MEVDREKERNRNRKGGNKSRKNKNGEEDKIRVVKIYVNGNIEQKNAGIGEINGKTGKDANTDKKRF